MLILSGILILVLSTIGDFDEVINQVGQEELVELGAMNNCDPGIAICSVAQLIDKKPIKLSLGFDQEPKNGRTFHINLKVKGINKQQIRRAEIHFQRNDGGAQIERFKYLGGASEMESRWQAEANLFVNKERRENWRSLVKISTLEEKFTASFLFILRSD